MWAGVGPTEITSGAIGAGGVNPVPLPGGAAGEDKRTLDPRAVEEPDTAAGGRLFHAPAAAVEVRVDGEGDVSAQRGRMDVTLPPLAKVRRDGLLHSLCPLHLSAVLFAAKHRLRRAVEGKVGGGRGGVSISVRGEGLGEVGVTARADCFRPLIVQLLGRVTEGDPALTAVHRGPLRGHKTGPGVAGVVLGFHEETTAQLLLRGRSGTRASGLLLPIRVPHLAKGTAGAQLAEQRLYHNPPRPNAPSAELNQGGGHVLGRQQLLNTQRRRGTPLVHIHRRRRHVLYPGSNQPLYIGERPGLRRTRDGNTVYGIEKESVQHLQQLRPIPTVLLPYPCCRPHYGLQQRAASDAEKLGLGDPTAPGEQPHDAGHVCHYLAIRDEVARLHHVVRHPLHKSHCRTSRHTLQHVRRRRCVAQDLPDEESEGLGAVRLAIQHLLADRQEDVQRVPPHRAPPHEKLTRHLRHSP
eukprot:Hpha_TRINITY_DN15675_c0_g7::TRINITY_DN15675_c0_g7_i1::g.98806::m.98806